MSDVVTTGEARTLTTREKIAIAADVMRQHPDALIELPVTHHFSQGLYAREMFIPKNAWVIGKIHKYQQLNIMSKGDLSVMTEDGMVRVQAPFTIVSPPGTQRIAYAHEDTIWTTIHGTHETDLAKIEEHFIAQDEAAYAAFLERVQTKEIG